VHAGTIELVARRHDDDRDAAVEALERHCKLVFADRARADAAHVGKSKHVAQELLDKADGSAMRRRLTRRELGKERLTDAEIARAISSRSH
jgi:hypothetical protein